MRDSLADIVLASRPENGSEEWGGTLKLGQQAFKSPSHSRQKSPSGNDLLGRDQEDREGALEVAHLVAQLVGGGGESVRLWAEAAEAANLRR